MKIVIYISIPVILNDNIDKFNSKSGFYNDICYTTTSDDGTDIILNDRRKEFKEGNKTICQDDCNLDNYDYNTLRAKCSCKVQGTSLSFNNMTINLTKIMQNFKSIK